MGLSKLAIQAESSPEAKYGPREQLSLRVHVAFIDLADEIAEALNTTRSEVLREMMETGYCQLQHEWDQALENGRKSK